MLILVIFVDFIIQKDTINIIDYPKIIFLNHFFFDDRLVIFYSFLVEVIIDHFRHYRLLFVSKNKVYFRLGD